MNEEFAERLTDLQRREEMLREMAGEETRSIYQKELSEQKISGKWIGNGPLSSVPDWINESTLEINDVLLAKYIIDLHGLKRSGKRITNNLGVYVSKETIQKYVADEIKAYKTSGIYGLVTSIARLVPSYIPESDAIQWDEITGDELEKMDLKPPVFNCFPILPVGLTVFAAPPKFGKSYFCVGLADAISTGIPFMGFNVQQGAVLYLSLEDSRNRLKQRFHEIGAKLNRNLALVTHGAKNIDNGLIQQIIEWINRQQNARLVIIDTITRVKGSAARGQNAYEVDTAQFGPLQQMAMNKNISVIAVTHLKKQNGQAPDDPFERISGSTGLFGVADAAWMITGKRNDTEKTFVTTGRDSDDGEYKIKHVNHRWELIGDSEVLQEQREINNYKTDPTAQVICELVKENGRWEGKASELREEIIKRKGVLPAANEREMGKKIKALEERLITMDHIMIRQNDGGRHGRTYHFEAIQQTM